MTSLTNASPMQIVAGRGAKSVRLWLVIYLGVSRGSIRSDISRLTHQIYPFFHYLEPIDRCSLV